MSEASRAAMTKADLINIVAKRLDITQVQSGIIVEAALRSIINCRPQSGAIAHIGFPPPRGRAQIVGECAQTIGFEPNQRHAGASRYR